LLFNILLSFVLNGPTKTFHSIEKDELDVSECQVFPDRYHGFQPLEMAGSSSYTLRFQRAKSLTDSGLANKVDGKGF
jgi:hypothetical protein